MKGFSAMRFKSILWIRKNKHLFPWGTSKTLIKYIYSFYIYYRGVKKRYKKFCEALSEGVRAVSYLIRGGRESDSTKEKVSFLKRLFK